MSSILVLCFQSSWSITGNGANTEKLLTRPTYFPMDGLIGYSDSQGVALEQTSWPG